MQCLDCRVRCVVKGYAFLLLNLVGFYIIYSIRRGEIMVDYFIALAIIVLLIATFLVARTRVGGPTGLITKAIASLSIIIFAFATMFDNGFSDVAAFVTLGLIFGMIGDIVLDLKVIYPEHNGYYLNAGMTSFSLGHFLYLAAIISYIGRSDLAYLNGPSWMSVAMVSIAISLVLSVLVIFVISPKMKLDFGKFKWQSFAYSVLLMFMAAFSIGLAFFYTKLWFVGAGMFMFLLSDLVLSTQYFGGKQDSKLLIVINHAMYYAAQTLIMSFLYFI